MPDNTDELDRILSQLMSYGDQGTNEDVAEAKHQIEQLIVAAQEQEHYYSHKARKEAGYAELYWCACGKYDQNKDRLLRHIHWQELKLTALKQGGESKQGDNHE